jgi:hypothetical protein
MKKIRKVLARRLVVFHLAEIDTKARRPTREHTKYISKEEVLQ